MTIYPSTREHGNHQKSMVQVKNDTSSCSAVYTDMGFMAFSAVTATVMSTAVEFVGSS